MAGQKKTSKKAPSAAQEMYKLRQSEWREAEGRRTFDNDKQKFSYSQVGRGLGQPTKIRFSDAKQRAHLQAKYPDMPQYREPQLQQYLEAKEYLHQQNVAVPRPPIPSKSGVLLSTKPSGELRKPRVLLPMRNPETSRLPPLWSTDSFAQYMALRDKKGMKRLKPLKPAVNQTRIPRTKQARGGPGLMSIAGPALAAGLGSLTRMIRNNNNREMKDRR